jgi:hypothetical protein
VFKSVVKRVKGLGCFRAAEVDSTGRKGDPASEPGTFNFEEPSTFNPPIGCIPEGM